MEEVDTEIGGELARRLINAVSSPPITDVHQMMIYGMSSWMAHKVAAQAWQQTHQDDLLELKRQYPDLPLREIKHGGPTGRYVNDGGERSYMLNLRQTLYLIAADDDPSATVAALQTWMQDLVERFYLGGFRVTDGASVTAAPHDVKGRMVEITFLYLKGHLTPADAGVEIALQDRLERLNAEHGGAIQMLFAMAGRQPA